MQKDGAEARRTKRAKKEGDTLQGGIGDDELLGEGGGAYAYDADTIYRNFLSENTIVSTQPAETA